MSNIDKQALREELSNPAIGSNAHLRELALALLDELGAGEQQIKTLESRNRRLDGIIAAAERRIAELQEHRKADSVEVIYQCEFCHHDSNGDLQWHWEDVNKEFYDQYDVGRRGKRRVLYTAPPAPVLTADISGIIERFQHQADHLSDWHHIDEHSCKVNRRDLMTALEFMNFCRTEILSTDRK